MRVIYNLLLIILLIGNLTGWSTSGLQSLFPQTQSQDQQDQDEKDQSQDNKAQDYSAYPEGWARAYKSYIEDLGITHSSTDSGNSTTTHSSTDSDDHASTHSSSHQDDSYNRDGAWAMDISSFRYALVYIDDDDIPELWIDTGAEATGEIVVTFSEGKTQAQELNRIGATYIEKQGLICSSNAQSDYQPTYIYELKNGQFTLIGQALEYYDTVGKCQQGHHEDDSDDMCYDHPIYQWEGKTCDQKTYQANINKLYDDDAATSPDKYYTYGDFDSILKTGKWISANHRYEFVEADCTWDQAQKLAKKKGGYLATITCQDEAEAVADLMKKQNKTGNLYYVGYLVYKYQDSSKMVSWLNSDGTYTREDFLRERSETSSPGFSYADEEFDYKQGQCDVGIIQYYSDGRIYVRSGPDDLKDSFPKYCGKMGYLIEYDK